MRQLALRAAVNRHWREKRQCLSPALFFVLGKAAKTAGNAVIPTFPAHCPHGLQHLRHKRPRLLSPVKVGIHTRLSEKNRSQRLARRNRGCFGWGRYHYPRTVSHVSETLRGRVSERHTLPLLGLGRVYSEERREPRDSDALMRVAVPRRRGPAGLRDLFSFLSKLRFSHSVLRAFRMCETWEVSLLLVCSACC